MAEYRSQHALSRRTPPRRRIIVASLALAATAVGAIFALSGGPTPVTPVADPTPLSVVEECKAALGYPARTKADRAWLNQCEHALTYRTTSPTPTAAPTTTPPPTTAAPPTTSTTTAPPTTTPPVTTPAPSPTTTAPPTTTPPPTTPPASGWPNATNTGVPSYVTLTDYTGPCVITIPDTVIDSKTVDCELLIKANNVTIVRSKVNGPIVSGGGQYHFDVVDSEVDGTPNGPEQITSIGGENFSLLRVNVYGGNRSVLCEHDCRVEDSWLHGQEQPPDQPWHLSAIRLGQRSVIVHNTLACDAKPNAVDGGCSANQTGYPDYEPMKDWIVQGNFFTAQIGASYCAYGGNSQTKPYSLDPANATFISYRDNVFERGSNGKCGNYGPVTDFAADRTGNVWSGNVWSDGKPVVP